MSRYGMIVVTAIAATWTLLGFVGSAEALPPDVWCPTGATEEAPPGPECPAEGLCDAPGTRDQWSPGGSPRDLVIRVKFNVFCKDPLQQECAAMEQDVVDQFNGMNDHFLAYGIQFVLGAATEFITDSRFYDLCGPEQVLQPCFTYQIDPGTCIRQFPPQPCAEEEAIKLQYADNPGQQLNIYVVNLFENTLFSGLGYFPWSFQPTSWNGGILMDGIHGIRHAFGTCDGVPCTTLSHETGHNLGLWHTHHGVSEAPDEYDEDRCLWPCTELASGVDCDTTGDFCCYTPATRTNFSCENDPSGSDVCSNQAWGNTDERNFMGYGVPDTCRDRFSGQQNSRMRCWTCGGSSNPGPLAGWIVGEDVTGGCCLPGGSCEVRGQGCCENKGGTFSGAATTCSTGACCMSDGSCQSQTEGCCTVSGGTFAGPGTT